MNNITLQDLLEKLKEYNPDEIEMLRFFRNVTFLIIKQISNKGKLC